MLRAVFVFLGLIALVLGQASLSPTRASVTWVGPTLNLGTNVRPINGNGNNVANPTWAMTNQPLVRRVTTAYDDGLSVPRGGFPDNSTLPNVRTVSNLVHAHPQQGNPATGNYFPSVDFLTALLAFTGQYLDHDLGLTPEGAPPEDITIPVPAPDTFFDPSGFGNGTIAQVRFGPVAGTGVTTPRQHPNAITGWIDQNTIYGSDSIRRDALRGLNVVITGAGVAPPAGYLIRCSDLSNNTNTCPAGSPELGNAMDYLPPNRLALGAGNTPARLNNGNSVNDRTNPNDEFVSGDVRCNENFMLGVYHTMWFREHNRRVAEINGINPGLSSDALFEEARRFTIAVWEHIAYDEFLAVLTGEAWPLFRYESTPTNPSNEVGAYHESTSGVYRLGHSMIPNLLPSRNAATNATVRGGGTDLNLFQAFFIDPVASTSSIGISPSLAGLSLVFSENIDRFVIDGLRNFLFGTPTNFGNVTGQLGQNGLDLAAINVNRAREVGIPSYSVVRSQIGLTAYTTIAGNPLWDTSSQTALNSAYSGVFTDIDLWPGAMSEVHRHHGQVGETIYTLLRQMYGNQRDGDRFWFENTNGGSGLTADQITLVRKTTLRDIVLRNTNIPAGEFQCMALGHRDGCGGETLRHTSANTPGMTATPTSGSNTFVVRHAPKASNHPAAAVGYDLGYSVVPASTSAPTTASGAQLTLNAGTTYTFFTENSCATRFYFYSAAAPYADVYDGRFFTDDAGQVSNVEIFPTTAVSDASITNSEGCGSRSFQWTPASSLVGRTDLYYGNRFGQSMGGSLRVVNSAAGLFVSVSMILAILAALLF